MKQSDIDFNEVLLMGLADMWAEKYNESISDAEMNALCGISNYQPLPRNLEARRTLEEFCKSEQAKEHA